MENERRIYLKNLRLEDVKENILYIEDINEGLKSFNNGILTIKSDETSVVNFKNFLLELDNELIVDYYGNKINDIAFERMINVLKDEEKLYLKEIKEKYSEELFFYNIEEKFLEIILKLSLEEILFSSFYIKNEVTIWGNYNKKFILFFKDKNKEKIYKDIAEKNNLILEDIRYI